MKRLPRTAFGELCAFIALSFDANTTVAPFAVQSNERQTIRDELAVRTQPQALNCTALFVSLGTLTLFHVLPLGMTPGLISSISPNSEKCRRSFSSVLSAGGMF